MDSFRDQQPGTSEDSSNTAEDDDQLSEFSLLSEDDIGLLTGLSLLCKQRAEAQLNGPQDDQPTPKWLFAFNRTMAVIEAKGGEVLRQAVPLIARLKVDSFGLETLHAVSVGRNLHIPVSDAD